MNVYVATVASVVDKRVESQSEVILPALLKAINLRLTVKVSKERRV